MMAAISRNGQCARRYADVLFRQRGAPGQAQARLACRNRRRPEAADPDAALGAAALRIAGYGVQGIAARNPIFCVLFYLIPLAAGAAALADIQ